MITTIIITALVSVFSVLVIGYFIWSGISARKLKKQVKDNENAILANTEWIKNIEDNLYKKEEELINSISTHYNESTKNLNNNVEIIEKKIDEIWSSRSNENDELHRELDKRFDKVYTIIQSVQDHHNKK